MEGCRDERRMRTERAKAGVGRREGERRGGRDEEVRRWG